jgi:RNA polymerase sigma factor (sigma-70 family)
VTLVREGYEAAFEEIVRRYGRPLTRYAAGIVGSRSEDVTQDAFSKALLALRRDDAEIDLRPWLYRIVRNTALNDLRDNPPPPAAVAGAVAAGRSAAEVAEQREELTDLIERLGDLPEPQRAAIVMRELEGLSHEEIAATLGMSGGAARQAIYRARQALRDAIGMLVPLPLLRLILDHGGGAAAGAGTGALAAGGAGGMLKAGAVAAVIAGTVGTGVALQRGDGQRDPAVVAPAVEAGTAEAILPSAGSPPAQTGIGPGGSAAAEKAGGGVNGGPAKQPDGGVPTGGPTGEDLAPRPAGGRPGTGESRPGAGRNGGGDLKRGDRDGGGDAGSPADRRLRPSRTRQGGDFTSVRPGALEADTRDHVTEPAQGGGSVSEPPPTEEEPNVDDVRSSSDRDSSGGDRRR